MTEKDMRARITQLEADLKFWQDAYRHLAESMAQPSIQAPAPPWPIPVPLPPQDPPYVQPGVYAHACAFTGTTFPATTTISITSTPPKGNEP